MAFVAFFPLDTGAIAMAFDFGSRSFIVNVAGVVALGWGAIALFYGERC